MCFAYCVPVSSAILKLLFPKSGWTSPLLAVTNMVPFRDWIAAGRGFPCGIGQPFTNLLRSAYLKYILFKYNYDEL